MGTMAAKVGLFLKRRPHVYCMQDIRKAELPVLRHIGRRGRFHGKILYMLSSFTSLIDGFQSPHRALRNHTEKEAQRGEIKTPCWRMLEWFMCLLQNSVFLMQTHSQIIYSFSQNAIEKNISGGSAMTEFYSDIFHQVEQV